MLSKHCLTIKQSFVQQGMAMLCSRGSVIPLFINQIKNNNHNNYRSSNDF